MLIKSCSNCEFHAIKEAEEGLKSHCGKEKCWSQFSKCVAKQALKIFLEQEREDGNQPISYRGLSYNNEKSGIRSSQR